MKFIRAMKLVLLSLYLFCLSNHVEAQTDRDNLQNLLKVVVKEPKDSPWPQLRDAWIDVFGNELEDYLGVSVEIAALLKNSLPEELDAASAQKWRVLEARREALLPQVSAYWDQKFAAIREKLKLSKEVYFEYNVYNGLPWPIRVTSSKALEVTQELLQVLPVIPELHIFSARVGDIENLVSDKAFKSVLGLRLEAVSKESVVGTREQETQLSSCWPFLRTLIRDNRMDHLYVLRFGPSLSTLAHQERDASLKDLDAVKWQPFQKLREFEIRLNDAKFLERLVGQASLKPNLKTLIFNLPIYLSFPLAIDGVIAPDKVVLRHNHWRENGGALSLGLLSSLRQGRNEWFTGVKELELLGLESVEGTLSFPNLERIRMQGAMGPINLRTDWLTRVPRIFEFLAESPKLKTLIFADPLIREAPPMNVGSEAFEQVIRDLPRSLRFIQFGLPIPWQILDHLHGFPELRTFIYDGVLQRNHLDTVARAYALTHTRLQASDFQNREPPKRLHTLKLTPVDLKEKGTKDFTTLPFTKNLDSLILNYDLGKDEQHFSKGKLISPNGCLESFLIGG